MSVILVIVSLYSWKQKILRDTGDSYKQSTGLSIIINDTLYSPEGGDFLVMPGRPNRIVIKTDESTSRKNSLRVSIMRKLPDGREMKKSIILKVNDKIVHFDLGPMSATHEYEYEAGGVFMKGYQLSIRVEEKGKYIGGWEFKQVLSKQVTPGRTGMADGGPPVKLTRMQDFREERQVFDPKFGFMPLFSLRLASDVLSNQDNIRILEGLNDGEAPSNIDAVLRITYLKVMRLIKKYYLKTQNNN